MSLKRVARWCATCKASTAHEINGKKRKCLKCGVVIEVLWQAGPQTEQQPDNSETMSTQTDHYKVSFDQGQTWKPISFKKLGDWLGAQDIKDVWAGETVKARGAWFQCTITTEARDVNH